MSLKGEKAILSANFYINKTDKVGKNNSDAFKSQMRKGGKDMIIDRIALILSIVGALNWGGIGLFKFDTVAWICGGQDSLYARIIYTVVAIAGVWCISLLFRARESFESLD